MFRKSFSHSSKLWGSAKKFMTANTRSFGFYSRPKGFPSSKLNYLKYLAPFALMAGAVYGTSEGKLGKTFARLASGVIPVHKEVKAECGPTQQPDLMKSRVNIIQLPANHPCEDRFDAHQLRHSKGYSVAVYDGHGGWQISEYAMANLTNYLDKHLEKATTDEQIKEAITKAYDQVEQE